MLGRPPSFCREPMLVPTCHTQFWRSPRKKEPPGVDGANSLHLSPLRLIFTIGFCAKETKCPSPVESLSPITCAGPVSVCWARNTAYSEDRTKRSTPGIELRVGTGSVCPVRDPSFILVVTLGQSLISLNFHTLHHNIWVTAPTLPSPSPPTGLGVRHDNGYSPWAVKHCSHEKAEE